MDTSKLLRSRGLRISEKSRPFQKFHNLFSEVLSFQEVDNLQGNILQLLEKHAIISTVTAIEIYFRESLDLIFRTCNPKVFEKYLKDFHKNKYDIEEVIVIYKKRIHPLELVLDGCNFQNLDVVTSIFTKILGRSLWESVFEMKVRLKERPANELMATFKDLEAFKRIFNLRHELIHFPNLGKSKIEDKAFEDIYSVSFLIFICDIVFNNFIKTNLDEELKK